MTCTVLNRIQQNLNRLDNGIMAEPLLKQGGLTIRSILTEVIKNHAPAIKI